MARAASHDGACAGVASQFALPLGWPSGDHSRGDADGGPGFLISVCNAVAVRFLEHPALWPVRAAILTGPPRSGRTLLGRAFHAATGGIVIDGADATADGVLFHAWNAAAQPENPPLLMIASAGPAHWPVALPDLRSRLNAAPVVVIDNPDDDLMAALIDRQFAARGTMIDAGLAAYLVPRIERSFVAIDAVVNALDTAALASRRRINRVLAREVLFAAGLIGTAEPAMPADQTVLPGAR